MTQWNSSYYRSKNYNRVIKGSIDSIINEIRFLPVETEICSVFLESINNRSSFTDLTKFIALSPALAFNILNLSQSHFYSCKNNITSFNDALKLLGNDVAVHLIKDFLVSSSNSKEGSSQEPSITGCYYGSLKSAHLAALIAEELNISSPFISYVAALLHNVGSVALSSKFPVQYNRLATSLGFRNSELIPAEEKAFGLNHCFLGARMVEGWGSFPFISDALFYHHHPLKIIKQASKLVRLTHFSSMVDNFEESDSSKINEIGRELFGFTESQIDEYISITELKVQNRLMHLGIEVSDNSESVYRPDYQRERIRFNEVPDNSLLSLLIDNVRNSEDKKNTLSKIGESIHVLTGLSKIYYFEYNKSNNSLDGVSLMHPENTDFSNDFSIPMDANNSVIVTSFLMGMDINSLGRVNSHEPALFDLQIENFMGTDGLYCLPLVNNDNTTGIIVLGINSGETAVEREAIEKLHYFIDKTVPFLSNDEVEDNIKSENNVDAGSSSLQTRKLIHEINNPLSAIKNYLKVLNMKLDDIDVENDEIRIIDDELNRIAKLLKDFKSSSPDKNVLKTTSDISGIISDTILLVENSRLKGPPVNIDFEMDEEIPDIEIDKDAFRQVLINLINNSIEAMPSGGNISVGVRHKNGLQRGNKKSEGSGDDGKRVEISIADDGPGFPDQLKSNIFKKQSTTKDDHDGLGLIIVHELVKKMGGNIILDDQYNKGACFKITLSAN